MKTPTLIVRLAGLYLLANGSISLIQISQSVPAEARFGGAGAMTMISTYQMYAVAGVVVGLLGACCAGRVARLLTFDAGRET